MSRGPVGRLWKYFQEEIKTVTGLVGEVVSSGRILDIFQRLSQQDFQLWYETWDTRNNMDSNPGSSSWALSRKVKGCLFNSRSGHAPQFLVWSPEGAHTRGS